MRSANGSNNNPTARQFEATYKKLLVRHEIEGTGGNCTALDKTLILQVSSATKPSQYEEDGDYFCTEQRDMLIMRRYDLEDRQPETDHDYIDTPNFHSLSPVINDAIGYIAGYVVRMTIKRIICSECQETLTSGNMNAGGDLLKRKNRGGLVKPSNDVLKVCKSTEQCIQRLLCSTDNALPQTAGIVSAIATAVLHDVGPHHIFPQLDKHMLDTPPDHNHVFALIKCIASCYAIIRMHHLAKRFTEKITQEKLRKHLSKLILFKHQ